MNRICKTFEDIGNINMNWAGVPAFNYQMLLSGPCKETRSDIVTEFCNLEKVKVSLDIKKAEESLEEKELIDNDTVIDDHIVYNLTSKYGTLEYCFPYITKFLFTGEMMEKSSFKQTYWRIFGDIAIANIRKNLENCIVCERCGAKIPSWATTHNCPKNSQGFYVCVDCGKLCERINSRQCRCPECQDAHRVDMKELRRRKTREEKKEREKQLTSFLQYRYRKTC